MQALRACIGPSQATLWRSIVVHRRLEQVDHDLVHEALAGDAGLTQRAFRHPIHSLPTVVHPADEHIGKDLAPPGGWALLPPFHLEEPLRTVNQVLWDGFP